MGRFGKLAGALTLSGALAAPLAAQETGSPMVLAAMNDTNGQITDCVGFVKEQQALQQEVGVNMTRAEIMAMLADCHGGLLDQRIAEQREILAALDAEIQEIGLKIDENARILDDQGRELARIIAINNQLVIQRSEVQADTARMLDEAERILQSLATS